jgi:hypothetical protein
MTTTIELREIFKLAHHDIGNKVFDQFAEEMKDKHLGDTDINEVINFMSEKVAQIYQEELRNEMIKNANKVIERSIIE